MGEYLSIDETGFIDLQCMDPALWIQDPGPWILDPALSEPFEDVRNLSALAVCTGMELLFIVGSV